MQFEDRVEMSRVEQPVSFVEHEELDPREHELARAHQIPHAPGRATYNVDACAQPLELRTWIHAT